jgi:hypothetical protein
MKSLVLAVTLALAQSTFAAIRFDPPAPDNQTAVTLTISGAWPDGCVPRSPVATIDALESRIVVDLTIPPLGCILVPVAWHESVSLGVLPAGVYDVVAFVHTAEGARVSLGGTQLVVRDLTTYTIAPHAAPLAGGTTVRITSAQPFDAGPLRVFFGGAEVQQVRLVAPNTIEVTAPPQTRAGAVDVRVESVTGGPRVARAAFTYYDPSAAVPDPFVFTWLLFPIDYAGSGAFGARWTTENVIDRGDGVAVKLPVTGNATGRVEYVQRDANSAFNSRIRDLSHQAQTAGTEVPVVRETDFRDAVRLLNVPGGANQRVQLRAWAATEPPQTGTSFSVRGLPKPLSFGASSAGLLAYGTIDLTAALEGVDHADLTIQSQSVGVRPPVWAMVSITNNETQQVTIVSPR